MGKLFNWFKKQSKLISRPPTSNINGIYSARLEDIDGIRKSLSSLTNQLQDLSNRIDSLPPIPDLNQYARKDQTNTFTQIQEIQTTAPYLAFKKAGGSRKGYIGIGSSDSNDMELRAETNSLNILSNHHLNLQAGNGYNITINREPTQNNSVVNKLYVDTKFASIPPVDLSNVAKLDQENRFTQTNNFTAINASGHITGNSIHIDRGQLDNIIPNNSKSLVNKEYVDNRQTSLIVDMPSASSYGCYIWKQTMATSGFAYFVNDSRDYTVHVPGIYLVILRIKKITRNSTFIETRGSYTQIVDSGANKYTIRFKIEYQVATWVDLYPGSNDRFVGTVDYDISLVLLKPY